MRSSSDLQVLSQNGQIKEPEVPELFSILTDSWRLSSILFFLQTILSLRSSSRTVFLLTRFFFKLFNNFDSSLTCSSLCSLVNSSTTKGAALAPVKIGIRLGGVRDLFLEFLLFLLGDASLLGENALELLDHPPLLCGDLENLLDLGDLDRDLEYLPLDLLLDLELEYLLGDLEYLLGDGEYLLGDLENLFLVGDLLRDEDREYLPRLLDLE